MIGAFFGASPSELRQFSVGLGKVSITNEAIRFENYPFESSIASVKGMISSEDILNICTNAFPPTVRVGNELLFISAEHKQDLSSFAIKNNLPPINRPELWDWILEPFLDTEFSEESKEQTYTLLAEYALTRREVDELRNKVDRQMMKYNFDTMLWEWGMFSALDVLLAMRPKLKKADFRHFYDQVMEIAIRPDAKVDNQ